MADVRTLSREETFAFFDAVLAFARRWDLSLVALAVGPCDPEHKVAVLMGSGDLLDRVLPFADVIWPQPEGFPRFLHQPGTRDNG